MLNEIRGSLLAYINARTADNLIRKCALNNDSLGMEIDYFPPQYVDGKWWTWYKRPIAFTNLRKLGLDNDATEND